VQGICFDWRNRCRPVPVCDEYRSLGECCASFVRVGTFTLFTRPTSDYCTVYVALKMSGLQISFLRYLQNATVLYRILPGNCPRVTYTGYQGSIHSSAVPMYSMNSPTDCTTLIISDLFSLISAASSRISMAPSGGRKKRMLRKPLENIEKSDTVKERVKFSRPVVV